MPEGGKVHFPEPELEPMPAPLPTVPVYTVEGLDAMTLTQIRALPAAQAIPNAANMTKANLIAAILAAQPSV